MQNLTPSRTGLAATLASLILVIASCDQGGTKPQPTRTNTTAPKAARHAVHMAKLRTVMANLGDDVREYWPQNIQDEKNAHERESQFRDARRTAKGLVAAADAIPGAAEGSPLSDADRAAFLTIVAMLKKEATDLEAAAAAQDLPKMKSTLAMIQTTCTSCHTQFRDHAGPLQFGKSKP